MAPSILVGLPPAPLKRFCGYSSAMADKRNMWTVALDGGGWGNRFEGSRRIMDRGPRKADVQKQGRERARKHKVEHIIQEADGTIGERNSYGGASPRRPG